MNKKLLLVIGAILLIATIGGVIFAIINKDDSTDLTNNSAISITYWGLWEPPEVMASLISDYEKENPNVKINYVRKSFSQYETSLSNQLAQPASPDIVRIHNTWTPMLQKYLTPMPSNVMTLSTYTSTFYGTAKEAFSGTDGQIYAIPLEVDSLLMFYNKDLFEKEGIESPPENWDDLVDIAKQLTKTSDDTITQAGAAIGSINNIRHADEILALLYLQNGADVIDGTTIDLSDDKFIKAIGFYTDFINTHKVWNDGFGDDLQMFIDGKLGIMFAPSWRVFDIMKSNPNINFDVAPMPQAIGVELDSSNAVQLASYWGEAVSKNSKNKDVAWDFIRFLSEKEQMQKFYANSIQYDQRAFGEPCSRIDLSSSLNSSPYVNVIMSTAPRMKQIPLLDKTTQMEMFYPLVKQKLSSTTLTPTLLAQIQEQIQSKINNYSQ